MENDDELEKYLNENPEVKEKYNLNDLMINFKNIPKSLQKEIIKEYKTLF